MMTGQGQRPGLRAGPAGTDSEDDAAVIRRSRDEPEHFAVLFRRYAPEVQRYVRRRIGTDAADDVVAETFLAAFAQRDGYDLGRACARPWLYGIATNLIGRYGRTEIQQYRVLARTGRDPVTDPFTDRVDAAVSAQSARPQRAGTGREQHEPRPRRTGMNETELLARLRHEIPFEEASPRAERLFLAGLMDAPASTGTARRPMAGRRGGRRPGRVWQLALTGGLAAAVAAVAVVVPHSGNAPGSITVQELAYRAAAAASRQPQVPPGQWVYRKELARNYQFGGHSAYGVWTTADSTQAAFVTHGNVRLIGSFTGPGHRQYFGQPEIITLPGSGTFADGSTAVIPITYAGLGSLPRSPHALLRHFASLRLPAFTSSYLAPRLHAGGSIPAITQFPGKWRLPSNKVPFREFTIIAELLTTYVMPPGLTAELYRALGDIPGVSVNTHAVDVAGRAGLGFELSVPPSPAGNEIIVDPHTYRLMGTDALTPPGPAARRVHGVAFLRTALVPGPGVLP